MAGVIVNGGAALFVFRQLGRMSEANERMVEANQTSNAMAVLTLEQMLRDARNRLADAALAIHANKDRANYDHKPDELRFGEALEQYLNVTDRLCSYIVRGLIDEEVYRRDYRQMIVETIRDYADSFGPATRHQNILKVHGAWKDDKPARELVGPSDRKLLKAG